MNISAGILILKKSPFTSMCVSVYLYVSCVHVELGEYLFLEP